MAALTRGKKMTGKKVGGRRGRPRKHGGGDLDGVTGAAPDAEGNAVIDTDALYDDEDDIETDPDVDAEEDDDDADSEEWLDEDEEDDPQDQED